MSFEKTPKVISGAVTSVTPSEMWPYDNGDQYWTGGSQPKYYRWVMSCNVTEQRHSDPRTRKPNAYDGYDVNVGDYVADITGKVLKIVGISFKSSEEVTLTVEDVNRFNIFMDPGRFGAGGINTGSPVVFFQVTDEGNPVLTPFPSDFPAAAYVNIVSRFDISNPSYFFQLSSSSATGLSIGDFISITPSGEFVKTSREHNLSIGRITFVNRAAGFFAFMPNTKIVDDFSSLPGDPGSLLYSSPTGISLEGDTPVMVKLKNNTKSSTLSALAGPTEPGSRVRVNGVMITLMEGTTEELIAAVNATTSEHELVAEPLVEVVSSGGGASMETVVASNFNEAFYGEPAAFMASGPLRCKINGVEVSFTTTTDGAAVMGDPSIALGTDMIVDLQNANIPDLEFEYTAAGMTITHPGGGDIIIENINTDDSGAAFAGSMSCSGLPLETIGLGGSTEIETQTRVRITAPDARPITFTAVTGSTLISDFGLFDVENGEKAVALSLVGSSGESSASSTFVVPTITARDALTATVGTQAMVLDKGDDEWGLYLFDGSNWVVVATEESAEVVANTASVVLRSSNTEGSIAEVNPNTTIEEVCVDVITPFDASATLDVFLGNALIMSNQVIDLTTPGKYLVTPNVQNTSPVDEIIRYVLSSSGSGELTVSVSYS